MRTIKIDMQEIEGRAFAFLHYGGDGPLLTVEHAVRRAADGTRWVLFDDPWAIVELERIADRDLHADTWAMEDDMNNAVPLLRLMQVFGGRGVTHHE